MPNPTNSTVIVTGTIGPGNAVTSLTIENVLRIEFDFQGQSISVFPEVGNIRQFSLNDIDTVTTTFPDGKGGKVTMVITT